MAPEYEFVYLPAVGSTQDEVRSRMERAPVVVAARHQSSGRGRRGSTWENADEAIALSIGFDLQWPSEEFPAVTLLAGVVVADVLASRSASRSPADPSKVRLKWPNDIMLDGRKVGGILTETESAAPSRVVIGIGLNLSWNAPPAGIGALGGDWPESDWLALAHELAGGILDRAAEPWPLARYLELCETVGRSIRWEPAGEGRAIDVDPTGGLVVDGPQGVETLRSGTVWAVG